MNIPSYEICTSVVYQTVRQLQYDQHTHTHKQTKPTKTAAHTWKEAKPKNTYKICAMTENVAKEIVCWIVSLSTRAQGDYHNAKNTHNFKQLGNNPSHVGWRLGHLCEAQMQVVIYITQCCFKSTETVQIIRAGEPGTSTSSFTQLLSSGLMAIYISKTSY